MKRDVVEKEILVPGFRFGSAACGIKKTGAPDLALLVSDRPAIAAAAFTRNRFRAAPVEVARERTRSGRLQAIVVNSGNANACTGDQGMRDARRSCELAAGALGVPSRLVAPASTGIIGVALPMRALERGIADAAASASATGLWGFARAITTSDAFPKVASEVVTIGRRKVTVAAIGKGAGMISPDMATLLVFLVTDAVIGSREARALVREVCGTSFNSLSVDGDTSTNDSLFLAASGMAGHAPAVAGSPGLRALTRAAVEVGTEIARQVAVDGEGATKLVTIEVGGARTLAQARRVARTVGGSVLVKTAFFGSDPNWGRIACAIGYAGVPIDPRRVTIRVGKAIVFRKGGGVVDQIDVARAAMAGSEFTVRIDLGAGSEKTRFLTSDLTREYVEFNSAYST